MENLINFIFNTSELRVIFTAPSQLSKHFKLKDKIKELEKRPPKILERLFLFVLDVFQWKNARVSITASDVTQNIISESEPHIYR